MSAADGSCSDAVADEVVARAFGKLKLEPERLATYAFLDCKRCRKLDAHEAAALGQALLSHGPCAALTYLELNKALRARDAAGANRGVAALTRAVDGGALPALESLHLEHNEMADQEAQALLAALGRTPASERLRKLALDGNALGDGAACLLGGGEGLRRVEWLGLGSNRIGDAGAIALATGAGTSALRQIKLRNNLFSAEAVGAISASVSSADGSWRQLEYLTLDEYELELMTLRNTQEPSPSPKPNPKPNSSPNPNPNPRRRRCASAAPSSGCTSPA